jgi:hypothetical protein
MNGVDKKVQELCKDEQNSTGFNHASHKWSGQKGSESYFSMWERDMIALTMDMRGVAGSHLLSRTMLQVLQRGKTKAERFH